MKFAAVVFLAIVLVGSLGFQGFPGEPRTLPHSQVVSSVQRSAPPSIFAGGIGHHHLNRAVIHRRRRFIPHYQFLYILPPRPVVITSPFFCIDHERGFINQAGFLDHVSGTHKISLENSLAFCSEAGSSCIFPDL